MRVLRASFIALLTAFVGCFLAFFVGDYLTRHAHMSNMEGGRGMFVVFVCAPLGILLGLVIGIISSILVRRQGLAGFFAAQQRLRFRTSRTVIVSALAFMPTIGKISTLLLTGTRSQKMPNMSRFPDMSRC